MIFDEADADHLRAYLEVKLGPLCAQAGGRH
jgi:hypothetical protein